MVARSRVEALHKCCSTTHSNGRSEAGNSPVIGETILGAYYLRIRMWQGGQLLLLYCRRGQTSKDETKGVGSAARSDVLLYFDTSSTL